MRIMPSTALAALLLALPLAAPAHDDGDYSKVNGSVQVEAGRSVRDASTVNGSVTLGAGAHADEVGSVNGAVRLEEKASAGSVETVNGSITLQSQAQVRESVEAVNGAIRLDRGARVAGNVENVNGRITLDAAEIGGKISTLNGDIDVGAGSHVRGGILVEKHSGWSLFHDQGRPRVTIGEGAVVDGVLRFEREVDLSVAAGATIGPIEGVPPRRIQP